MIPVGGVPVLDKLLQHLRAEGIRDLAVVRGYQPAAVQPEGVTLYDNARWAETGELASLAAARAALTGDVVIVYGDVLFKRYVLHELTSGDAPITVVVDGSRSFVGSGKHADLVRVSAPPPSGYDEGRYTLVDIGEAQVPVDAAQGEWIGLLRARGRGTEVLRRCLDAVMAEPGGEGLAMDALLRRVLATGEVDVRVLYIQGDWADIDGLADVAQGAVT
jgi:phosphoenolpyruvate phosphomutase